MRRSQNGYENSMSSNMTPVSPQSAQRKTQTGRPSAPLPQSLSHSSSSSSVSSTQQNPNLVLSQRVQQMRDRAVSPRSNSIPIAQVMSPLFFLYSLSSHTLIACFETFGCLI